MLSSTQQISQSTLTTTVSSSSTTPAGSSQISTGSSKTKGKSSADFEIFSILLFNLIIIPVYIIRRRRNIKVFE